MGGIGSLMAHNKIWLSQLGIRAVIAAALANILSAMMAALLL